MSGLYLWPYQEKAGIITGMLNGLNVKGPRQCQCCLLGCMYAERTCLYTEVNLLCRNRYSVNECHFNFILFKFV